MPSGRILVVIDTTAAQLPPRCRGLDCRIDPPRVAKPRRALWALLRPNEGFIKLAPRIDALSATAQVAAAEDIKALVELP